jgi:hypothetical protein
VTNFFSIPKYFPKLSCILIATTFAVDNHRKFAAPLNITDSEPSTSKYTKSNSWLTEMILQIKHAFAASDAFHAFV